MKKTLLNTGHAHSDVVTIEMMPRTEYCLTPTGRAALDAYLNHMQALIEAVRKP